MATVPTSWFKFVKVTYAEVGRKPRRWGYSYYIKLPLDADPRLREAHRIRLVITRPDFAIPPFEVVAWRHQVTSRTVFFELPKTYSLAISDAFKDVKTVAILALEVVEEKNKPRAERGGP